MKTGKIKLISAVAAAVVFASAITLVVNGPSKTQSEYIDEKASIRDEPQADDEIIYYDEQAIDEFFGVPLADGLSFGENTDLINATILQAGEALNAERIKAGLMPLEIDTNGALSDAALVRAYECSIKWSHTRPDGSQWYTVNSNVQWGENLAYGYLDGNEVVAAWMASPSHRENILRAGFKSVAMKIYVKDGVYYWAQEFNY